MAQQHLRIPGVTQGEELVAFGRGQGGRGFDVVLRVSAATSWLVHAAAAAILVPQVVLVTDQVTVVLGDVLVVAARSSTGLGGAPLLAFALEPGSTRVVSAQPPTVGYLPWVGS